MVLSSKIRVHCTNIDALHLNSVHFTVCLAVLISSHRYNWDFQIALFCKLFFYLFSVVFKASKSIGYLLSKFHALVDKYIKKIVNTTHLILTIYFYLVPLGKNSNPGVWYNNIYRLSVKTQYQLTFKDEVSVSCIHNVSLSPKCMLFVTNKPMRKYVVNIISRSARRFIFAFLELIIYRHNLDLLTFSLDAGNNVYKITNT